MDTQQYAREVAIVIETQMVNDQKYSQPALKLIDAKAMVLDGKVQPQDGGTYLVQGSEATPYTWDPTAGCTCAQATKGHRYCKHAVAVALFQKVQQALGNHPLALPMPPPTGDERQAADVLPDPPAAALDDWPEEDVPPLAITPDPETEADLEALAAAQAPPPGAAPRFPLGDDGSTPHPACGALHLLRSVQVSQVIGALLQAQAQIKNPRFDTQNPHFKTRYASLAAVRDTLTPALTAAGLVMTQFLSTQEGTVCCETLLWHTSGEYLGSSLRLPAGKTDAQGYGAASTYARRYGLMALCNVVGDEDDEADTLAGRTPGARGAQAPPPTLTADQSKRRIMDLLRGQGARTTTKEEVQRAVLDLTGLPLEERHFGEIVRRLEYYQPQQAG